MHEKIFCWRRIKKQTVHTNKRRLSRQTVKLWIIVLRSSYFDKRHHCILLQSIHRKRLVTDIKRAPPHKDNYQNIWCHINRILWRCNLCQLNGVNLHFVLKRAQTLPWLDKKIRQHFNYILLQCGTYLHTVRNRILHLNFSKGVSQL